MVALSIPKVVATSFTCRYTEMFLGRINACLLRFCKLMKRYVFLYFAVSQNCLSETYLVPPRFVPKLSFRGDKSCLLKTNIVY